MKSTEICRTTPISRHPAPFLANVAAELLRYYAHLRDLRGLTEVTRKERLRSIGQFLQDKFQGEDVEIGRLCPDDIRQFLAQQLVTQSSASYADHLSPT